MVAAPIYILTNSTQGFPFLHIIANNCYFYLFDNNHSNTCEVTSCCDSELHFPDK